MIREQPLLAFAAAAVGVVGTALLAGELAPAARTRAASVLQVASSAIAALLRLGREGREPGAVERRQLLACGAVAAVCAGMVVAGPVGALVALLAPVAVSRALHARRVAYRRAVDRGAPAIAVAIADALAGGRSLRRALLEAHVTVAGAAGVELRRVSAELATGQQTEAALDALRLRCSSSAIDAIVAAALVQRRSGGNLAELLRRLARSFEDHQRLVDEVRVATAQARFTGALVVVMPLCGAILAELASPGLIAGVAASPLTAWLVGLALALQAAAGVLIKRLGRVRA